MAANDITCLLNAVVAPDKMEIRGNWVSLLVEGLIPDQDYELSILLWSLKRRPITIEVHHQKLGNKCFGREVTVENHKDKVGKPIFMLHKLTINPKQHDKRAIVRVGWPKDHPHITTTDPFWVSAYPPKEKGIAKSLWKNLGLCPQCGKEGEWISMALVCPDHGVYAG